MDQNVCRTLLILRDSLKQPLNVLGIQVFLALVLAKMLLLTLQYLDLVTEATYYFSNVHVFVSLPDGVFLA